MNLWKQLKNRHEWSDIQHHRVKGRLVSYIRATYSSPLFSSSEREVKAFVWLKPAAALVMIVILIGGSGVAMAAKDSAPYERLYPIRVFAEKIKTRVERDPVKKVEKAIAYSEERLVELRRLAEAQAAAEGKGISNIKLAGEERIRGFKQTGEAIDEFTTFAKDQIEHMLQEEDGRMDKLASELDAVLDASLGILLSVEVSAGAHEPVRAVVSVAKRELSPLESDVETSINRYRTVVIEKIDVVDPAAVGDVAVLASDGEEAFALSGSEAVDEEMKNSDIADEKESLVAVKIEIAREVLDSASSTIGAAKEKFGDESVSSVEKGYNRAHEQLTKAAEMIEAGDYREAFELADEALHTGTHIKTYVPIIDTRATILFDDFNNLKLEILPEYRRDFMPK